MNGKAWTKDEKKYLRGAAGTAPYQEMALHLKRTVQAIYQKVWTMGLTKRASPATDKPASERSPTTVQLLMENSSLKRKLERQAETAHVIGEALGQATKRLRPIPPPRRMFERSRSHRKLACHLGLQFSDLQAGMFVAPEDTLGLGGYDYGTFTRRLERLKEVTLTVADEQRRVRPIRNLVIFALGDYLEGEGIYPSQQMFLDLAASEQFVQLHWSLVKFLRDLACHFEEVKLYGVWGNHGRMGHKGELHPRSNLDYLLLVMLQRQCEPFRNVKIFPSLGALMAVEIFGQIHVLRHGDETTSWMGIPFYGMERDTLKQVNMLRLPVSYAHIGHHHRNATWDVSATEIMMNGAFCGPTELSVGKMKVADRPSQNLFLLHPEHGLNWRAKIILEQAPVLRADGEGIYTPYQRMKARLRPDASGLRRGKGGR